MAEKEIPQQIRCHRNISCLWRAFLSPGRSDAPAHPSGTDGGECCVSDLADKLVMEQSAVSHQLRVLRDAALVQYRRQGKTVYYSLADEHVYTLLEVGLEHVAE